MKGKWTTLLAALLVLAPAAVNADTVNLGSIALDGTFEATHFSPIFDLTKGDLVLSYTIDMSGVTQPAAWETSYTEVGIRQVGAGDFNPGPWNTYQGGAGGWMASLVGDLTPNNTGQNLHDKHNMSASGGRGEGDYDSTDPNTVVGPFGTTDNHGIWFDRDGVDPWQVNNWGNAGLDGDRYNTGGVYDIVITYHAISAGLGTMFATVNGIQTGFYTAGWKNQAPDIYPAGLSFKGNMAQMQVFAGLWAPATGYGSVGVNNIRASGTLVPEGGSLALLLTGLAPIGLALRRIRK